MQGESENMRKFQFGKFYRNIFWRLCTGNSYILETSAFDLKKFNNTIRLSRHEQVCLSGLRFDRYFSHHRANDARSISRNVAHLNILVHDVINLLYYEYRTDKQKYFYVKQFNVLHFSPIKQKNLRITYFAQTFNYFSQT